jgi:hypothetical protein
MCRAGAVLLRPGNAGSSTVPDHIGGAAQRQLPSPQTGTRPRRPGMVRADAAGCTHEVLKWLAAHPMLYSVGSDPRPGRTAGPAVGTESDAASTALSCRTARVSGRRVRLHLSPSCSLASPSPWPSRTSCGIPAGWPSTLESCRTPFRRTLSRRQMQRRGQPRRIGQIRQQTSRQRASRHTLPIGGDRDLRTNRCGLHLRSASLRGRSEPRQLRSNRPEQAPSRNYRRCRPQDQATTATPGRMRR